jgi:hypothetical protein
MDADERRVGNEHQHPQSQRAGRTVDQDLEGHVIEAQLIGEREILARFNDLSPKVHLRLVKAMRTIVIRLQSFVKGAKLSGDPLKNRTGNLRRSIGEAVSDDNRDEVVGKVGIFTGPTLVYGRAHEFGFEGIVTVREHLRTVKQAFGRSIAPVTATVHSHSRHMHLPERSFLRSSLRELGPAIEEVLSTALREAVRA